MWRARHWLFGKMLFLALFVMPESAAKTLLCEVLDSWGRHVQAAINLALGPKS
jgi:hypothetical protein